MAPQDRNASKNIDEERDDHDDRTIVKGAGFAHKSGSGPQQAYLIVLNGTSAGKMYKVVGDEMIIGRSANADILLTDDSVSRNHARIVRAGAQLQISDLGSTNGTYANGQLITTHTLNDGDKVQVGSSIILKFSYQDNLEEAYLKQLYESATKDGLTEIYNKKYFLNQLNYEFSFAQRKTVPLSLIVFDLDKFKSVNDTYGHLAGDATLKHVAKIVASRIRGHDLFARYGGEEFVLLLRETDDQSAALLGERIRRQIEQTKLSHDGVTIGVTVSVGVASTVRRAFHTPAELIEAADMALYRSKENGRNRVSHDWEREGALPSPEETSTKTRAAPAPARGSGKPPAAVDDSAVRTQPYELPRPPQPAERPPNGHPTAALRAQPEGDSNSRKKGSSPRGSAPKPP
jgi:diguanylate cyclase (GGDEF)-like protein